MDISVYVTLTSILLMKLIMGIMTMYMWNC